MRVSDIIRGVLDLLDREVAVPAPAPEVVITVDPQENTVTTDDEQLTRMRQIAGLLGNDDGDYSNSPEAKYATIDDVMSHGDDINKPKHPADIRTNAASMYPDYQARS
jgi:hypothetical protein